jgi:hypothetical protein
MSTDQKVSHTGVESRPQDLLARLYREIGISAVAAALEASRRMTQKPNHKRKDIPAVLRSEEVA